MRVYTLILTAFLLLLTACGEKEPAPHIVNVIANEYHFEAPDTIEAGWTTFNMVNKGSEEHLMLINPISDSTSMENVKKAIAWLQELHEAHQSGDIDKEEFYAKFGERYPPTKNVQYAGGVGLLSPGREASATIFLEPGRYVLECYVKNKEGVRHNHLGLINELNVKETNKETNPPDADYALAITNNGISYPKNLSAGTQTIQVYFNEQPEGYVGNDVNIYRANDSLSYREIKKWLDVFERDGMVGPAPVTFIGGIQEVPSRGVGYFTVYLKPGVYYSISEKDIDAPSNRAHFVVE